MSIHDAYEKFRFGLVKIILSFLRFHKIRSHLFRPSPLCFIKDYYPVNRSALILKIGIPKVVNVLDEGFDLAFRSPFSHPHAIWRFSFAGIPGQGFLQN